jgi:hypothetical protein
MAKAKAVKSAKEETVAEKIGHSVGNAIGAIKQKFNELVHPDEQPVVRNKRAAVKRPAVPPKKLAVKKTAPVKKTATTVKPAAKKSAAAPKKKISPRKK